MKFQYISINRAYLSITNFSRVGTQADSSGDSDIIRRMAAGRKKKRNDSIFESIRKPTAPPTRTVGTKRPNEKVDPAGRSAKHKKREKDDVDL